MPGFVEMISKHVPTVGSSALNPGITVSLSKTTKERMTMAKPNRLIIWLAAGDRSGDL